mgnify:CR=1 FL=1
MLSRHYAKLRTLAAMRMTHQNSLSGLFVILLTFLTSATSLACSCMDTPTLENALQKSAIVIKGRALDMDTVDVFDTFVYSKKGLRVGKERLIEKRHLRLRFKVVVDNVYKGINQLPDTIYIITGFVEGFDCGLPLLFNTNLLISADNFIDKEIIDIEKKNKKKHQIRSTVSRDTFVTSSCHYTRHFTKEIGEYLKKADL